MEKKYRIECSCCGIKIPEDAHQILCPCCGGNALLTSVYSKPLTVDSGSPNLYRYRDWLPVRSEHKGLSSLPGCYQSRNLAGSLGLSKLWILFSGYWPEKGATLESTSFKEFEAIGVLSRIFERTRLIPIICSAGNTGLSALFISRSIGIPAVVVAPESACREYRLPGKNRAAKDLLISVKDADYKDCIEFVATLSQNLSGIIPVGGVYNIARRDFLGIPMIHGAFSMKEIPDHYFQAVGSGTGAIAAWEACSRLNRFKIFPQKSMRLHLAQNRPFTPIVNLWENRPPDGVEKAGKVLAQVLTNPDPPYGVAGGVRDALSATQGQVYGVTNAEIREAKAEFQTLEGMDIQYPAAASLAALKQAVEKGRVRPGDSILLHITGGGRERLIRERKSMVRPPALCLDKTRIQRAIDEISAFSAGLGTRFHERTQYA
ncbi:cysteate synthase [Desulfospira joergensenii]|uniref:cysteate synthase n=1 Tax=Desulfospira joergensenii TaxID=53329 RepID=UPI0003B63AD0|nr:cysteate synthase [Desulfospira joergensenii]